MKFLVPQGIGDSVWCLLKMEDANRKLGGGPIDVRIACINNQSLEECRAMEFISRFGFVNSVAMYQMPRFGQAGAALAHGPAADPDGYYRYLPDGSQLRPILGDIDYVMMPNAPLERGVRLENWLPQFDTNWDIMSQFSFAAGEREQAYSRRPYAIFYCGSLTGNTTAGHNRNGLWTPADWADMGEQVRGMGLDVVVVGAAYDRAYYESCVLPLLAEPWEDMIGGLSIGGTLAMAQQAKFVLSYQSGIGITASYLGTPVGIFWRAKGDSISSTDYISFDEGMASAWAAPRMIESGRHLPLIYGRHGVGYITDQIKERKWV